jgi:hypothetical protein
MNRKISVNLEQRLYVIPLKSGRRKGFTCLGFEYAFDKASAVARWLTERGESVSFPEFRSVGTANGYRDFMAVMNAAKLHYQQTKEHCPIDLCPQLIGLEGKRVEVVDGYGDKRRFYVGKSTGYVPCHLEIARDDSTGGFPVMGAPFKLVVVLAKSR